MTPDAAHRFAQSWLKAWNAHDLDAVLDHFTDDATFASPVAAQLLPETGGRLVGKAAIRGYWSVGLARIPDLHFEIVDVFSGIDIVVINYRNQAGGVVNEVLRVNEDGLVVQGDGTYLVANSTTARGGD